jgi:xylan 1,4-beta-xylosidase
MHKPITLATSCALLWASGLRAQDTNAPPPAPAVSNVTIEVDFSKTIGRYEPLYPWFGYDEANYGTQPNGRALLRELHDLSPSPVTIRVHHLLTSGDGVADLKWSSTNVYREDAAGNPVYDFTILDGIFDAYQRAGVRPLVELGFMPKDLAADLPDRQLPYQVRYPQNTTSGASNNPPKDYSKWGELVRRVTAHLVQRYGRQSVLQWYFEVWNEPNISYWHGTAGDYWKLYDYGVAGVRAALPGARVGGPASTGPGDPSAYKFLDDFLQHVTAGKSAASGQRVPLDFISFHAKGRPQIDQGRVTMGIAKELTDADKGFEIVARYPQLRALPIILSEADPEGCAACSSKVNPANNYRNGTLYPAYTAAAYKALFELRDRRRVNLSAMLSWAFEFENKDYFEGFRSLSTNGIDKPVLNFFRMAALMSGDRVRTESDGAVTLDKLLADGVRGDPDVDALATRAGHEAAVLLWNYHDVDVVAGATPVTLHLRGFPATLKRVLLTQYRIDDTHSNAYTAWLAMGSPQQPSATQYAELKRRDGLQLFGSPQWLEVVDSQATLGTALPRQSVGLLHFDWN